MEEIILYDKRECHWRVVFEENDGWADDKKAIIHTNTWGVYMNDKNSLLGVGIVWKCQVLMARRFFGNW